MFFLQNHLCVELGKNLMNYGTCKYNKHTTTASAAATVAAASAGTAAAT